MARSSRGFSRGHSQRRKTAWGPGPGGIAVDNFAASATRLIGSFIQPVVEGMTVTRIRGQLNALLTSAATVGDGYQGAFGIGIATLAAVTAGFASVPTPVTEAESENWLYWTPFSLHASRVASLNEQFVLEVDSKAMRKFPGEMAIYAALEVTEIGAAVMDVFFDSRVLVFLP